MMKTLLAGLLCLAALDTGLSQHFQWTVMPIDGPELFDVHPDSIRGDTLVFSTAGGSVLWLPMDSIRSITYAYNPTLLTLTVIGGMIGGTAGNNSGGNDDRKGISIAIGVLSGTALGYLIGDMLGVQDELQVAALPSDGRNEVLAQRVAHWSGKLKIIP
jgi:hypothetical protein